MANVSVIQKYKLFIFPAAEPAVASEGGSRLGQPPHVHETDLPRSRTRPQGQLHDPALQPSGHLPPDVSTARPGTCSQ